MGAGTKGASKMVTTEVRRFARYRPRFDISASNISKVWIGPIIGVESGMTYWDTKRCYLAPNPRLDLNLDLALPTVDQVTPSHGTVSSLG